jgi:putative tryptophan/tyrosine transport system substrate-binding protein
MLLAAGLRPRAIFAEAGLPPVIGFLSTGDETNLEGFAAEFREGLKDQGYVPDISVFIRTHYVGGDYAELDRWADELVKGHVAVIAATGGAPSAKAAIKATRSIPIVFVVGSDPVKLGLVESIAHPGGNATGVALDTTELAAKRLGLLLDCVPQGSNFGILVNPNSITTNIEIGDVKLALSQIAKIRKIDGPLVVLEAKTEDEIDLAFKNAAQQHVQGLLVSADPLFTARRKKLTESAVRYSLPTLYPVREYVVKAGGLISYGPDIKWAYHAIGVYAARILSGEKAADLPVQMPDKFELVINLTTAKKLGLEIPSAVRAIANQVIE